MMIDPENPVVKLCTQGMQAEGDGKPDLARSLFEQAWEAAQDDYEACIAAHYLARHQPSHEETLRWNQEALTRAEAVDGEKIQNFFPSLYLNMGHSYELLQNKAEARKYFQLAAAKVNQLPGDRYGDIVRGAVAEGLKRLKTMEE